MTAQLPSGRVTVMRMFWCCRSRPARTWSTRLQTTNHITIFMPRRLPRGLQRVSALSSKSCLCPHMLSNWQLYDLCCGTHGDSSDSSIQMNVRCLIWPQPTSLIVNKCMPFFFFFKLFNPYCGCEANMLAILQGFLCMCVCVCVCAGYCDVLIGWSCYMLCLLPGISSLPISTLPVPSPAFFQNIAWVLPVLAEANTGCCVDLQNKICHAAHRYRQLMQAPMLSVCGM